LPEPCALNPLPEHTLKMSQCTTRYCLFPRIAYPQHLQHCAGMALSQCFEAVRHLLFLVDQLLVSDPSGSHWLWVLADATEIVPQSTTWSPDRQFGLQERVYKSDSVLPIPEVCCNSHSLLRNCYIADKRCRTSTDCKHVLQECNLE
jgi:hypothetical protein